MYRKQKEMSGEAPSTRGGRPRNRFGEEIFNPRLLFEVCG